MRYERIMQSINQISASARALAAELMQEERQADRRERINGKPSRFERVEDPAAPNGYRLQELPANYKPAPRGSLSGHHKLLAKLEKVQDLLTACTIIAEDFPRSFPGFSPDERAKHRIF